MANAKDVYVKCPYYRGSNNQTIRCEGVRSIKHSAQNFESKTVCDNWIDYYCNYYYSKCPVCKMVDEEYRRREK